MKKKYVIGSIGATVLMLMLAASPVVTSYPDFIQDEIATYLDSNSNELSQLDEYYKTAVEAIKANQSIPDPEPELLDALDSMVMQWQEPIEEYYEYIRLQGIQPYIGVTAFFQSVDNAQFFLNENDEEYYRGYCKAFNKIDTDLICLLVIGAGGGVAALVSLLIALIPVLGLIYGILLGAFIAYFWPAIVAFLWQIFDSHPYGMALFRFDNQDSQHIWKDKLKHHLQPLNPKPYNPIIHYNQTEWEQTWP